MSTYYASWDHHDEVYRGVHYPDKKDVKARERGEPEKMVVPLTYAQTQTFIAFCFALFYQRSSVFELQGMNKDGHVAAKIAESLVARDLNKSVFDARLYQLLLDVCRFGLGVVKTGWVEEKQLVKMQQEVPPASFLGIPLGKPTTTEVEQWVMQFQGNKVVNVSPYRFFPDVRLPICRFQEGEFCASEDEMSITTLYSMENDGAVAGIKWIKPMTQDTEAAADRPRRLVHTTVQDNATVASDQMSQGTVILTEVQVNLIPAKFMIEEKPMGPETYPVKYNVWYVNDQRVVKAEPLGYVHNQFTYDVAEFSPDQHNIVNEGLAGTIDQLQAVITWFINSHITSVRKTIQNWLVVDPRGVNMKDIEDRSPVIRMKEGAAMAGIDRFVKQLGVVDVTQSHVQDAEYLQKIVQIVTGINDNALGMFHGGRRSATEARNVNSAVAARLKMIAQIIFRTCLEPMARKMVSNLRDGLSVETYVKVQGETTDLTAFGQFKKVSKADLVGEYDFDVFDGTLPSERFQQAQTLQELLTALMSNPAIIQVFGYDPRLLMKEVLELRGIKNPERFQIPMQQQGMIGNDPTGSVIPIQPNVGGAEAGGMAGV